MWHYVHYGRPLTDEEIAKHAPAVLNQTGSASLTKKYAFLSTRNLIADLKDEGWLVYGVQQRKPQTPSKANTTKHMVVFRKQDQKPKYGYVPELIITNSHDGRDSLTFYIGLYNEDKDHSFVVFDNEIFEDKTLDNFRITHKGYTLEHVKEMINDLSQYIPEIYARLEQMSEIKLDERAKKEFALQALQARWEQKLLVVDLDEILVPIRQEDKEPYLINFLSHIQDKLLSGGIKYKIRDKDNKIHIQTARALVNLEQKIAVKMKLWQIAADFIAKRKTTRLTN